MLTRMERDPAVQREEARLLPEGGSAGGRGCSCSASSVVLRHYWMDWICQAGPGCPGSQRAAQAAQAAASDGVRV